jgi:hypothetical protein
MPRPQKTRGAPHFKVQVHDPFSLAWRDYRSMSFETVERARAFQATLQGPVETRVMRYDEHGAAPVVDDE